MGRLSLAAALAQGALATRRQWQALPPERRARLQVLIRQAAGGPSALSAAERRELRMLVGDLKLGEAVRSSATRATARRGFRRR